MLTGHWTNRSFRKRTEPVGDDPRAALVRLARLAAAALALPALLAAPVQAQTGPMIPICSGAGPQLVYLPAGEGPPDPSDHAKSGCAHFTCPRDRGDPEPSDDEEG